MSADSDRIHQFWQSVDELVLSLNTAAGGGAYGRALAKLHEIHPDLYLEVSASEPKELIVTAEGDRSLFLLVHAVIDAAPMFPGWTIHALKPKAGLARK